MQKKPHKNLALDGIVPPKSPSVGVKRRPQQNFPEIGRTLSSYKYDAFKAPPPKRRKKKGLFRGKSKKKIAFWVLLPFLLIGLWLGGKFIYNASKIFRGNVLSVLTTTKLDGEDQGRVNILLAGNSADDIGHQGGNLTDSIMIISINTRDNSALMLSIPRDLYVDIPGNGHGKINEAFVDGEKEGFSEDGYANGGMGLLEKTIYETIGIKSNYYALVNYSAFRDTVNAVGGIDVNIHSSDKRGLYDPSKDYTTGGKLVKLSNGNHHIDGQTALNLARARGDAPGSYGYANSDFTRTSNQRMMLLALKQKITTSGVLANPIKLSKLSDALGKNVKSDMELSQVRRLYDLTKKIGNSAITSVGLNDVGGTNYLTSKRTNGQDTLIPAAGLDDYSDIRAGIRRLMSNNAIVRENANVVVLNATDVNGLASDNQDKLQAKSVNVTKIADARTTLTTSKIIDISGSKMPKTLALLKSVYGATNVTTTNDYASRYPEADFIVLVGNDKIPKSSTTND
jgi:LCP family protein required for cell wall assembly